SPPLALVGSDRAAYVLDAGAVIAVDSSTGRVRWVHPLESPPTTLAAGTSAVAVTLSDARVVVLSTADGRLVWARELEGQLTAATWSGTVLVVGSSARAAWGLDARDGDVKWRWPLGGSVAVVAADPERAFLATRDNLLRAVNRGNGHQRWQQDLGTRVQDTVVLDGAVLVVGLTPTLSLYDSLKGTALGTYEAPGKVLGTPLVDRTLRPGAVSVVVLLRDGHLVGLQAVGLAFREQPVRALTGLPGRTMPRERLPAAAQ
ncbi:MAG TPA: PQQ-binding-like beta-propeller repeat protein, partial [Vicinamibacterales bacterium]